MEKLKKKLVAVGMSGGVDSSVAALLLKEQGYEVIGLFMKNWEEEGACSASLDFSDVARVCEKIKIPYYTFSFTQEYRDKVFSDFLEKYKAGLTPNPDILCNREIKFDLFLKKALSLGADYLATGHYAQITPTFSLTKGVDPNKDQSYFLYTLKSSILKNVLFPIGHLVKPEVREIARQAGLPTAEKKDSTGICFIGERSFRPFLSQYLGYTPGNFENLQKEVIGTHQGIAYYTIGQRKGMGIGGQGEAWYVADKDPKRNVVTLVQGKDHPALFTSEITASELTWVNEAPPFLPYPCSAKVRYRQQQTPCLIEKIEKGKAFISFSQPQRAVTPGQSIVFYQDEICLGGGIIDSYVRPLL